MKLCTLLIILVLLFPIWNCNDKTSEPEFAEIIHTKEVFITWHGEYEVDGCGFIILINLVEYKASNEELIGDEFKTTEIMKALIEYEDLGNKSLYYCGDSQNPEEFNLIKLFTIEKIEW